MNSIKKEYDIIIVGAGPAGLECAKNLINSKYSVLLINRDKVHHKVCCNYLHIRDFSILHKKISNFNFPLLEINYYGIPTSFNFKKDKVFVTERKRLFNWYISLIKRSKNIEYLYGNPVTNINKDIVILQDGTEIKFKYLIGADGASSIVRNYLNLPSKNLLLAIQYPSKKEYKNIKVFFNNKVFSGGYVWIGVHKDYTVIGGGARIHKDFRKNLEEWIKDNKFAVKFEEIQSCILNCDYRGYKFGDIFLAGDAAGLVSAFTLEGIYPAVLSGRQVAYDLLGIKKNVLRKWLIIKKIQDYSVRFVDFLPKNKILFNILLKLLGRPFYKLTLALN